METPRQVVGLFQRMAGDRRAACISSWSHKNVQSAQNWLQTRKVLARILQRDKFLAKHSAGSTVTYLLDRPSEPPADD